MNPFLTIHGPRPAAWWAVCDLCGQASQPRFESAEAAVEWEHDCHIEEDRGEVTVTIALSDDDPPAITWEPAGPLPHRHLAVLRDAVDDLHSWVHRSYQREKWKTWNDMVQAMWVKRREDAAARAIAQMEEATKRPYVCPGCRERYMKPGGLKRHMRACYRIDPFKLQRGEYNDAMVPGGVPSDGGAAS